MGVVCLPIYEERTNALLHDGRILLKRVSQQVLQKRGSYHQHFVPQYTVNHALKNKEWKALFPIDNPNISVADFLSVIAATYEIEAGLSSDLVLTYDSYGMCKGKPKRKPMKLTIDDMKPVLEGRRIKYKVSDELIGERELRLSDLTLKVNPKKGKLIEQDITCDSQFMMSHIRDIGQSIRTSHSFLPKEQSIYLFMDNAGGHGKIEIKREYERILATEFNVLVE